MNAACIIEASNLRGSFSNQLARLIAVMSLTVIITISIISNHHEMRTYIIILLGPGMLLPLF